MYYISVQVRRVILLRCTRATLFIDIITTWGSYIVNGVALCAFKTPGQCNVPFLSVHYECIPKPQKSIKTYLHTLYQMNVIITLIPCYAM